jgi:UDP-N-acetylglucosamine--N-acetylmuramyl-(pentapeptide) pyrophosphoryl-undecaprenol N-acetylglucosamine transferase
LICAGGTGGGVYPALAVLEALKRLQVEMSKGDKTSALHPVYLETLWVGSEGGMEADLVKRAGFPYRSIPAAGVHGVNLRSLPRNLWQLARGVLASQRILRGFRPDVLFFTGGYVAVPMAFTGQCIPTLLYVPDIEPGLALKALSRFADRITVTAPNSQRYFNKSVIVTGYPLRSDLSDWERNKARTALGLSTRKPTLLIFGGSQGARSLNKAVLANLPALLEMAEVVHISGQLDWDEVEEAEASLKSAQKRRYHTFPYLHEMGKALAVADLVISRSGASSLGEFPFFGIPAVLVPYPHAWRYQKVNASYLAWRGAAVIIDDSRLQDELLVTIKVLLENPGKLESMQAAMRAMSKPDAARAIASQLLELAGEKSL